MDVEGLVFLLVLVVQDVNLYDEDVSMEDVFEVYEMVEFLYFLVFVNGEFGRNGIYVLFM